jgi:hypothetical protein
LNADGSFYGMTVIQLKDQHAAEISAAWLTPKKAASVEIWFGDVLISKESKLRPVSSRPTPWSLEAQRDVLWWRAVSTIQSSHQGAITALHRNPSGL